MASIPHEAAHPAYPIIQLAFAGPMHSQIAASHVHRCDYCAYHLPVVLSITFGVYQTIATSDSAVLMAVFLKNMVNKVNGLSMHQ